MTQQQDSAVPPVAPMPSDLQSFSSSVVTSTNQLSVAATSMAASVHRARVSGLKRAATAAVATYGANSAEADAANQAVSVAQVQTGRLQIVHQRAATTPPTVDARGWALHGRVYDGDLKPQERYTVFLVDAQKNYLSEFGFSYTDPTGYFLIQYSGAPVADSSSGSPSSAGSSADSEAAQRESGKFIDLSLLESLDSPQSSATSASAASTASMPQAFIEVCDADANPVFASSTPFTPVAGQAVYQVLTLPTSIQPLGDPPAEIRAVAMPPAKNRPGTPPRTNKCGQS